MKFRLTYAGKLLAHKGGRSEHVHDIRWQFHEQLEKLWEEHPLLSRGHSSAPTIPIPGTTWGEVISCNGYNWKPIATECNGLICSLDILMLRNGRLGKIRTDIDNRLKTLFDALRMANSNELKGNKSKLIPNPFYVLLQDDSLITGVAVSSDMLLEPVPEIERLEDAVRLVINVTIQPYKVSMDNIEFYGI